MPRFLLPYGSIVPFTGLGSKAIHSEMFLRHTDTLFSYTELQQEIQKESAKYIRHSLRGSSATPPQPLSAKDLTIPQVLDSSYAEISRLGSEKEALAQRLVALIARARARLDHDLSKVLVLQGEPESGMQTNYYFGASRNPVQQINESLRNAITIPEAPASPVVNMSSTPLQKSACAVVSFFNHIRLTSNLNPIGLPVYPAFTCCTLLSLM